MTSIHAVLCVVMLLLNMRSEAQFLYPVDPNPPTSNTTLQCFTCSGNDCDVIQERGTHSSVECSGPRIACWTLRSENGEYSRTCVQPPEIRQGVFCNNHNQNKEFCYVIERNGVREKVCAKCCFNGLYCNSGLLEFEPDSSLQTCVACDGTMESVCNNELELTTTYAEQCLISGSDCWTQRMRTSESNNYIYTRGCQLRTCNEDNLEEVCSTNSGGTSCEQCCEGNLCNRFNKSAKQIHLSIFPFFLTMLLILLL